MTISLAAARSLTAKSEGMDADEARDVLELLISGSLAVPDGAGLLVALAERGETARELAEIVRGLLERAVRIPTTRRCMDLCGTGGSGLSRYNVSTTVAFVLAAAGVPVAKHGNRGSTRPNGSFDFLDALGVPFALAPQDHADLLERTNCCFLFARAMHPAVAAVAAYRKAAGRRTIFNLAGPLANPCRPARQIIGVSTWATARVIAGALRILGVERALVVRGEPGIDEISVSGPTRWLEVVGTVITEGGFDAPAAVPYADLPGGDAADNAAAFHRLMVGQGPPALLRVVAVNAAAALDLWRDRPVLAAASSIAEATALITDGTVGAIYEQHRRAAQSHAAAEPGESGKSPSKS
ncbi:MAG: anthranilate phosphoribosyltransferase [Planctomycetes bacterium]|nr:anthranilate phosphoribosyltransferase [Planctomycetota bacterium]